MNTESVAGLLLVLAAILFAIFKRGKGSSPTFNPIGPGTGGGGNSPTTAPDTSEVDQPWIDLDYGGTGNPDNAPAQVARWYGMAEKWAALYSLPWQIVLAQIWQESWGDPDARGANQDYGLMQVTPIAVEDLRANGYDVAHDWMTDPESNIAAGCAFLRLCYERSGVLADALGLTKADALESYNEGFSGAQRDIGPDEYSVEVINKARKIGWNG